MASYLQPQVPKFLTPKKSNNPMTLIKRVVLDIFLMERDNFKDKMLELARMDPIGYYREFIMPFMPKDINIDLNSVVDHDISQLDLDNATDEQLAVIEQLVIKNMEKAQTSNNPAPTELTELDITKLPELPKDDGTQHF